MDVSPQKSLCKIKFYTSSIFLVPAVFWTELRYKVITPQLVNRCYAVIAVIIISSELSLLPVVSCTSSLSAPTDIYKPTFSGHSLG